MLEFIIKLDSNQIKELSTHTYSLTKIYIYFIYNYILAEDFEQFFLIFVHLP